MMKKSKEKYIIYLEETKKHHKLIGEVAADGTKKAVRKAKKSCMPITYMEGVKIVQESPSGAKRTIKIIENNRRKVIIGSKEKIS